MKLKIPKVSYYLSDKRPEIEKLFLSYDHKYFRWSLCYTQSFGIEFGKREFCTEILYYETNKN